MTTLPKERIRMSAIKYSDLRRALYAYNPDRALDGLSGARQTVAPAAVGSRPLASTSQPEQEAEIRAHDEAARFARFMTKDRFGGQVGEMGEAGVPEDADDLRKHRGEYKRAATPNNEMEHVR